MSERIEHRADALFALPDLPRRATLLGDLPGWRRDLEERRIELVDAGADVVVADAAHAGGAIGVRAPAVVAGGARDAAGRPRRRRPPAGPPPPAPPGASP